MSYGWINKKPNFLHNLRGNQMPGQNDWGYHKLKAKAYLNPEVVNCEYIKRSLSKNSLHGNNKIHVNPNFRGNELNQLPEKTHFQLNNLAQIHSEPGSSNAFSVSQLNSNNNLPSVGNERFGNTTVVTHQSRFKKVNVCVSLRSKNISSRYSWSKGKNSLDTPYSSFIINKVSSAHNTKSFKEKDTSENAYKETSINLLPLPSQVSQTSKNFSIYRSKTKIINESKIKLLNNIGPKSKLSHKDKKIYTPMKRHLGLSRFIYNNKISPATRVAKALRTKYKYLNNSEHFKKSKYKIDKRSKLEQTVKKNLNMIKDISKLFPDYFYNKTKLSSYKIYQVDNNQAKSKNVSLWRKTQPSNEVNHKVLSQFPNKRVVKIGGILYKSTTTKLTLANKSIASSVINAKKNHIVYVRGEKFILEKNGKALRRQSQQIKNKKTLLYTTRRIDIGGVTYIQKSQNVLIRTNVHRARYLVNKAKNKSIAMLTNLHKRSSMPCIIYHRFGKCNRHVKGLCIYKHDPKNIAVCKNYLKGNCANENCLLSHQIIQEKMATCHFFLNGNCVRENCPFLHVKLNKNVAICENFLQGFCTLGKECSKRHFHQCPNFDKYGTCKLGFKCLYPHKKQKVELNTEHLYKNLECPEDQCQTLKYVSPEVKKKQKKAKKLSLKGKEDCAPKAPKKARKRKNLSLNSFQQNEDTITCLPKRIKLEKLPCYIPLKSNS